MHLSLQAVVSEPYPLAPTPTKADCEKICHTILSIRSAQDTPTDFLAEKALINKLVASASCHFYF